MPLLYAKHDDTRQLHADATIHDFGRFKKKCKKAVSVEKFLCNLHVCTHHIAGRGITWYELYILYRMRGHPKPIQDNIKNKAAPRANAAKLINAFKNQVRNNISRCILANDAEGTDHHSGNSGLFKPAKAKKDGLSGVGILGKHPTLSVNVYVSEQEAKEIAQALVQLSRTISKSSAQEYINQQRNVIPTELKLNGKSSWDTTLPINASAEQGKEDWKATGPQNDPNGTVAFFRCPNCAHVESCWCKPFQYTDLDNKIKCNGCQTHTKVAVWKCICDRFWHRCPLHRESAACRNLACTKLKTSKQISGDADSCKKAKLATQVGPDSHEWLLAEDVAKEKRKRAIVDDWDTQPTITLGYPSNSKLNPAFLGPSLKRRFLDVNSSA